MTLKRTFIVSVFFHSMVVYVALLCIRNIPIQENTILVEIKTSAGEDHAAKGDVLKQPGTEARAKALALSPKRKKGSPPALNEMKDNDSGPDEMMKGKREELRPVETMVPPPLGSSDAVRSGGKGADQGGSESGIEGLSLYIRGMGGDASDSSFGSGIGDGNAIGQIREAIERAKIYPELARKRRLEGMVVTEFSINDKGLPENIRVTKSPGFTLLDSAARDTIIKAAPFPVVKGRIEVPINFILK